MARLTLRRAMIGVASAPILALAMAVPSFGVGTGSPTADPTPSPTLTATPLTPADRVAGSKSATANLAKTPQTLLDRKDSTRVSVMIKYDYDAVASYAGARRGLAATSPRATGRKLTGNSAAERAYTAWMAGQERAIAGRIRASVPGASIGRSFRTVYGGVQATVPANRVKDLVKVNGVVAVQLDQLRQPLTDASSDFVNATGLQESLGGAGGKADAGKGVIYGNLDTGVWPEHPSFADQGNLGTPPGPARACDFGDNPTTPEADPFECQNKLIGGHAFLDTYLSDAGRAADEPFHTARDSNGHGTHTSSTSAGNVLEHAEVFGVDRGPIRGLAPGAWVIEYKVCGILGCFDSDSAAAVGQAVLDGVDVINFSISGGTDPLTDPVELAFLDAYAANVFVSASAGNEGPGAGTANHLSPWVTTVGASTQRREFGSTLHLVDGAATLDLDGVTITAGAGPLPIVLSSAAPYSDPRCLAPAPAGTFTGKIVACQRGTNARVEKGYNVLQGGAAGMVLYNPTLADVETDNHFLPTVHLATGEQLLAFLADHPNATASFGAGEKRVGQGDVMAAFSSRGPAGKFIKPDVTAPGVQILAGHTPVPDEVAGGPQGQYFQAIAGTSMSSPHVAGAALLVRAANPSWSAGAIKSALMTSSLTEVVKEDLETPADPFDMGAGRIDVGNAAGVGLVIDESAERYAALTGSDVGAVHLNVPSINAPVLPGRLTTTRTVTNVSGVVQKVAVATDVPDGTSITVSPSKFNLDPGLSQQLTITISTTGPVNVQQFATIRLEPRFGRGGGLHLPVAFVHKQAPVSLTQSCDPTTIARGETTECTIEAVNNGPTDVDVTATTTATKQLLVTGVSGATQVNSRTVSKSVTLQGNKPGVPDVASGQLFGYIPLSAFGITPTPVGDEAMVNFNVPAFSYTGRTFSRIGVDSNGYVVVGGGTAEDNNCCNLPTGANPAPPNNVLAPFWTDLDGTGAPGIRTGILSDGVSSWIVVEHQVNVWGTTSLRTFQTWIGISGEEDITFAYPPTAMPTDPAGQDFLIGAENSLGEGDLSAPLPTGDLRVISSAPQPGGKLSYTVTLTGVSRGNGTVTTELTSPALPGTTVVSSDVRVN